MSWWTSVVNGTKMLGDGAAWVWNSAPVSQVMNYASTTAYHVIEQGLAAWEAFPALKTPSPWKIVEGMGNILCYDVLPIVALNYANNGIQNYFREGYDEESASMLAPYALFLSTLTLVNYGVHAFSYREAAKLVVHTLVLDSIGPTAFNEFKALQLPPAPTLCKEKDEECNFKRRFKGSLREPLQLIANDVVLWGISKLPYFGEQASWLLGIYFYGEYITRMATPERCERHKAMKSESVLALGLTYTATSAMMDFLLESTLGLPPYLYHRTLKHLLLLLHINLAAHMTLPLVRRDAISLDPLVIYESSSRFALDVVFAGLMKRIPIDFRPPPGSEPLIPLSTLLKSITKALDTDLEKEKVAQPGFFKQAAKYIVPRPFHSTKNLVNDPVIKLFWPDIQKGMLCTVELIESTGKPVGSLTNGPRPIASALKLTLPTVLNYRFGLPYTLSEFLLSLLSKKEDFWNFIDSLRHWLERNNVSYEIKLTTINTSPGLHGETKVIELPPDAKINEPIPSAIELKTPSTPKVADAESLTPKKILPSLQPSDAQSLITRRTSNSIAAISLFSTKQRPVKAAANETQKKEEEESAFQYS